MSKRGKSKRSHRCAVFLSVVLCAGLFTGCGDKKRLKSVQGALLRKKMYETRMMGSPLTNSQISQKPILLRQNRIRPLWKMQHRKMWITVKRLEA